MTGVHGLQANVEMTAQGKGLDRTEKLNAAVRDAFIPRKLFKHDAAVD